MYSSGDAGHLLCSLCDDYMVLYVCDTIHATGTSSLVSVSGR